MSKTYRICLDITLGYLVEPSALHDYIIAALLSHSGSLEPPHDDDDNGEAAGDPMFNNVKRVQILSKTKRPTVLTKRLPTMKKFKLAAEKLSADLRNLNNHVTDQEKKSKQ